MVEVSFDEVEVGVSGTAEVLQLSAFELDILTGTELLVDASGANFVANCKLVCGTVGGGPGLVPEPDVVLVMEKFAAMASGDGAEKSAAVAGFEVDEVAAAGSRRED